MSSRFGDSGGAANWKVSYEVDFAAQPDQLLNADGVYAIAGRNWTVENSANKHAGATGMRITNGIGLRLPSESNPATQIWQTYRLEPMIGTALPIAESDAHKPWIAMIHAGTSVGWGSILYAGVEYPAVSPRWNTFVELSIDTGATAWNAWSCRSYRGDATLTNLESSTARILTGNDIAQLEWPFGAGPWRNMITRFGVFANGDWLTPMSNAEMLQANCSQSLTRNGTAIPSKTLMSPANWRFFLTTHFCSVGAGYETIVKKVKFLTSG